MKRLLFTLICCAAFSEAASASLIYQLRIEPSSGFAVAGGTFSADLVLEEIATAGEDLRFFTEGLSSVGPMVINHSPTAPATSVLELIPASSSVNSDFDIGIISGGNPPNFNVQMGAFTSTPITIPVNATSHQMVVASLVFDVTGSPGEQAIIDPMESSLGDVFFGTVIDPAEPVSYIPATVTVVAVPEPSSFLFFGLCVSWVAVSRNWRRWSLRA